MKKYLIILILLLSNVHSLQLQRVILSTDANPMYYEFWPIVASVWHRTIGLRPTLALIAHEHEIMVDTTLGDVIRFEPIEGVPTSFYAQVIRLLLPALFENDGCIVSDIDMLPLNKHYFIDSVQEIPQDHFVVYRDNAYDVHARRYPMCYIAGQGRTFQDLFHIYSINQIPALVKQWYAIGLGWDTDEFLLYWYIDNWSQKRLRCSKLGHGVNNRIDRSHWIFDQQLLQQNYYIDAHLLRPYMHYKKEIDLLFQIISNKH